MATIIEFSWYVEQNLTDVTSAKLNDPDGTFGVRRYDNHEIVVAAGTPMERISQGIYRFTIDDPEPGLVYNYYVEVVFGGATYHFEYNKTGSLLAERETLTFAYDDILRQIARLLNWDDVITNWSNRQRTDAEDAIRKGLLKFYNPPRLPGTAIAHRWKFNRPVTMLDLWPTTYSQVDGAVSFDGSTSRSTITVEGATFFPTMRGKTIRFVESEAEFMVDQVINPLTVTLIGDASDEPEDAEFLVVCDSHYPLPDNFAGIEGDITFKVPNHFYPPMRHVGEQEIRALRQGSDTPGWPRVFSLVPRANDQTREVPWDLVVYPQPQATAQIEYRGDINVLRLSDYRLYGVPQAYSLALTEAILSEAEIQMEDQPGVHTQKFWECLSAAIDHDNLAHGQGYFGANLDQGLGRGSQGQHRRQFDHFHIAYNGVVYRGDN